MRYGMFYDYDRYARFLRASFTMRKRNRHPAGHKALNR